MEALVPYISGEDPLGPEELPAGPSAPRPGLRFPLARFLPPVPPGTAAAWLGRFLPHTHGPAPWVLDPFGAAPAAAVEAARSGYRVLVAANNPIDRFLLELSAAPPTESELRSALAALAASYKGEERLEPHLRSLYLTRCATCGREVEAEAFIWEREGNSPVASLYACPACSPPGGAPSLVESPATELDVERAARFSGRGLHRARALERVAGLDDPDRLFAEEAIDAYLPRALYALFTLVNKLDTLDPPRRRLASALLLAALDSANNLWPHPASRSARQRPRQLSAPARFRENNVWLALEDAVTAWSAGSSPGAGPVPVTVYPELPPESGGLCIFEGRLKDLAGELSVLGVPAVLAALPRPNAAFWTLSALWAGWLWGKEAAAPFKSVLRRRRYDWGWHATALFASLRSMAPARDSAEPAPSGAAPVLPAGTPFFALVPESEPGFLSAAVTAAGLAGFSLEDIALRGEAAQLTWRAGSPPPSGEQGDLEKLALPLIKEYLRERGEPAPALLLFAAGLLGLERNGHLPGPGSQEKPAALQSSLEAGVNKAIRLTGNLQRLAPAPGAPQGSAVWWLPAGEDQAASGAPLADRVEMAVVRAVHRSPGCTAAEIDRAACEASPGLFTPDPDLVRAVLASYALPLETPAEGDARDVEPRWELRPEDAPRRRRAELDEVRASLLAAGKRLEYRVSSTGTAVLWESAGEPRYAFHVLASAVLGELFARAPEPGLRPVLVYPGGRASLIHYKLSSNPRLAAASGAWLFLKFRHLRRLLDDPGLSRAAFTSQVGLDPLVGDDPQMRLF